MVTYGPAALATISFFGAIGLLTAILAWVSIREDAHSPAALTEDQAADPDDEAADPDPEAAESDPEAAESAPSDAAS